MGDLEKQLQGIAADKRELEKKLGDSFSQCRTLQMKLKAAQEVAAAAKHPPEKQVECLRIENDDLKEEVEDLRIERDEIAKELAALKGQLGQARPASGLALSGDSMAKWSQRK